MAMVTVNELRRRVKRGAHMLDARARDWARNIHLPELEMRYETTCILGQTFGNYGDALPALFVRGTQDAKDRRAISNGFTLSYREFEDPRNWSRLAELWATEIAVRQLPKKG